jgi:type 1 fimbria pilin
MNSLYNSKGLMLHMIPCWRKYIPLLALLLSFATHAVSNQVGATKNFNIHAKIKLAIECKINDEQAINIPFGNVAIAKIDSGKFVQPISYHLNCENSSPANTVILRFTATGANFDPNLVTTTVDGLGVRILKDGTELSLNKPIDIPDPDNPPKLEVLLVRNPAVDLVEAQFSAGGSLIVEYY